MIHILACMDICKVVELRAVTQGIVDDKISAHHELSEQLLTAKFYPAYAVEGGRRLV